MSYDYSLWNVSAEEYHLDLVRVIFINALASHYIRQRLLESNELTVDQAFNKTRSLFQVQEYSAAYTSSVSGTNSVVESATREDDNSENEADIDLNPLASGKVLAVATILREKKYSIAENNVWLKKLPATHMGKLDVFLAIADLRLQNQP